MVLWAALGRQQLTLSTIFHSSSWKKEISLVYKKKKKIYFRSITEPVYWHAVLLIFFPNNSPLCDECMWEFSECFYYLQRAEHTGEILLPAASHTPLLLQFLEDKTEIKSELQPHKLLFI